MFKKLTSFVKRRKIISAIIACIILMVCTVAVLYFTHNPIIHKVKMLVMDKIYNSQLNVVGDEVKDFNNVTKQVIYQNDKIITEDKIDLTKDVKKVYYNNSGQRFVNYPDGYSIDLPKDYSWTFNNSPLYVTGKNTTDEITISREWSPYEDVDQYLSYYLNRFIESEEYRKANNITLLEDSIKKYGNSNVKIIKIKYNNLQPTNNAYYSYFLVKTDGLTFYRIMLKSKSELTSADQDAFLNSFKYFKTQGTAVYDLDLFPVPPNNWSTETKNKYEEIKNGKKVEWGIFTENIYTDGIDKTIPAMEEKLDYKFNVILSYVHFNVDFPIEFMQKNYEKGRMVELTYQITTSNNEKLFGYTPNLDIYRGLKDEEIRAFARKAKAFGHPFLFRVNNEMNSDWTSYAGIVNLSDPGIFIENWRRIYRIFQEEGVDNAIWIYNPNDRNYPPCSWNNFMAYYPGNDYVQMIGVTGYNNGTYYAKETGEKWREFKEIYDDVQKAYLPIFEKFPWIITEFSSSSIGGDKVNWINGMFENIGNYPQIKIAVWFSFADYDYRPEKNGAVSRPYWLDETPDTLAAFKKGIKSQNK